MKKLVQFLAEHHPISEDEAIFGQEKQRIESKATNTKQQSFQFIVNKFLFAFKTTQPKH